MEIPKLTYFLAAAQTLNFRRAAELCSVAQPVLSRQIAALEADLGVELFKRVKKRVQLTEAGQEFVIYARQALEALQQGQQAMVELHAGARGLVRVGCIEGFGTERLPQIFVSFQQRFPQIRLQVCIRGTDELLQLVENQQLDFAVVGMTFDRGKPPATLVVRDIFRDQLHMLVAPHHPLVSQRVAMPLLLKDVAREPLVLLREGFGARRVIERVFAQRNLPLQAVAEVDMLEGVLAFVRLGIGATFVPPSMIRSSQRAEVVALPLADLKEEFVFALVQRRLGTLSAAANVLMRTVLHELKQEIP
ncbi:LysR family transcriptional regulator [Ktedonosporobacter rubrisoli]|uniref:LysR family transcriptional regulator n=1 Tax=Ktedonosporobacter rubrisoli TaxID=2509675 RepID=A0A4P6JRQ3_KTERU|nr:LysR family transcriptional regulator [Ktedonosporobacter rubrisoli]QBD77506.1 LysR family transcriptional regulator [Ktedonosporobacter rubrisoli]